MPELIRLIQDVETAGFDGAGILDSQLLCRDTFVTLGHGRDPDVAPDVVPGGDQIRSRVTSRCWRARSRPWPSSRPAAPRS